MDIIVNIVVYIFGLLSGVVMISLCQSVSKIDEDEEHRFDGRIFYLCDQDGGCDSVSHEGASCYPECHHTSDIFHAKNFEYTDGGYFFEKESKEYENMQDPAELQKM